MKIALVSAHTSPLTPPGDIDAGGLHVHVTELARAMGERGHAVTVYTRRDDPALPKEVGLAPDVSVVHIDAGPPAPLPRDALWPHVDELARGLSTALADAPADVVHSHSWLSGAAAERALGQARAVPLVHTPHALGVVRRRYPPHDVPEARLETERALVRSADHIVTTSSDELFELRRLGLRADRVTVLPSGVDLDVFTPKGPVDPRRPGWDRVVVVSRLLRRKGLDDVVLALADVPNAELIIAGGPPAERVLEDPEAQRLLEVAQEAGVLERVSFRGGVSRGEVAALLRSADVVVSAPRFESFGNVALEAMACGAAVIATPVGGLIDTVLDGLTGVHVPPGNTSMLAQTMNHLLGKPYWRLALGAGGAQRAHNRYGWPRIGDATVDIYGRLSRGAQRSTEAG